MRQPKIIVVGGGLAGLMATIRVAEAGVPVELFSIVPVKRSHSVCAQGGINAAKNQKGEGDTTDKHFDDTIYGGDFLANQPLVKRMCEAAPGIIDLLDRMGVMFNRTPEGSTIGASAARSITARLSREQPRANNSSTLWTSKCGATKLKTRSRSSKVRHFSPR